MHSFCLFVGAVVATCKALGVSSLLVGSVGCASFDDILKHLLVGGDLQGTGELDRVRRYVWSGHDSTTPFKLVHLLINRITEA